VQITHQILDKNHYCTIFKYIPQKRGKNVPLLPLKSWKNGKIQKTVSLWLFLEQGRLARPGL